LERDEVKSNKLVSNGVKVVLVSSLVGFGTISVMPGAYAAVKSDSVTSGIAGTQNTASGSAGSTNMDGTQTTGTQTTGTETLTDLEINGSKIDLTSNSAAYSTTVDNKVDKISLLLKSDDPAADIKVNDQEVNNGEVSEPLQTGVNVFTIQVESSDHSTTTTYKLTVTRQKSGDNFLKDLKLSTGKLSPSFQSNVTTYEVDLEQSTSSLTIGTELEDNTASVLIHGKEDEGKGIKVDVPQGKSSVAVKVTAENGDAKVYTITLVRAAQQPGPTTGHGKKPVSNPSPAHGKGPVSNPGSYPGRNQGKPSKGSQGTGWKGNANPSSHSNSGKSFGNSGISFGNGNKSGQPTINYQNMSAGGSNGNNRSGTFQGTASNGASQKTQTVNSAANLSGLTVSAGTWNKDFASTEYTYHIALTSGINKVTIQAEPSDSGAVIDIQGNSDNTITIGSDQSKTIVPIVVTKGDERKTYVLVFDKQIVKTAVKTVTSSNSDSNSSSVINTSASSNSPVINTIQNGRQKGQGQKQSPSLWSRIVQAIQSFFS
jgi:hypothetical protein